MATRAITTNQPEVSCDMCGRTLLRGERPDVFLASGSRRTVCELCIPRAAGEGWLRESEALTMTGARGARSRPGRSLLDRLRQRRNEPEERRGPGSWDPQRAGAWPGGARAWGLEPDEGEDALALAYAGGSRSDACEDEPALDGLPAMAPVAQAWPTAAARPTADVAAEQAIGVFNASGCAARVAGIARALGEPSVMIGVLGEDRDRVRIVVAWELCWYRYEVDLIETPATIKLVSEGVELEELPPEDRLPNACADERGELSLLR